ncbi:hypothetical protein JCM12178A_23090 [Salidesulfovibrio brasiliensis]
MTIAHIELHYDKYRTCDKWNNDKSSKQALPVENVCDGKVKSGHAAQGRPAWGQAEYAKHVV